MSLADVKSLCQYNAQDVLITTKLLDELLPRLDERTARVSAFEHACQGPALAMMLRGLRRDPGRTDEALRELRRKGKEARSRLPPSAGFTYEKGYAPSPQQIAKWLYGDLKLPKKKNRSGQISTDEECLQRLRADKKVPEEAVEWIDALLELRGFDKDRQVLEQKSDPDGKVRCSWSVGATETGRWSSSKSPMGTGGNFQALAHHVRRAFVPDPGKVFIYVDLRQAESKTVAHLSGDSDYINAHDAGDTHAVVAERLWPHLSEQQIDIRAACPEWGPKHPWRQWAKRTQHALNYRQTPFGMGRVLKIPVAAARTLSTAYFRSFPGIRLWHEHKAEALALDQTMVTPLGRVRQFLGRPWDGETLKEAIAHEPQSIVADLLNVGLLRVWWELERAGELECLAQGHDAILIQCPEPRAKEVALNVSRLMLVPLEVTDIHGTTRTMTISSDWKVGGDWGEVS